jgi:pilin isopeptide linkage protein
MDINSEKKNNMNRIAPKKRGWQFVRRATALLLTMMMVLTSSFIGVQAYELPSDDSSVQSSAQPDPINLEEYMTADTNMKIVVTINGQNYSYTPQELAEKNLTVPKGSPVKVELYFKTISNVQAGQQLVYQLPENLMDYSGANEYGYVWQDTVWEENNAGAEVEAADWVIDDTGKLTVTIRDDFFEGNKHSDNTIDLFGFNIKFSGSFSSERGEHSGNDDNVITFRGETDGTGKISYTIPFEYKNENANAEVEKSLVNYDVATRTASYVIKVTAPDTNTSTAKNVVVTDDILCESKYIETVKTGYYQTDTKQIYRNFVASTGEDTFDNINGIWTIGDMEPGQVETLTYNLLISEDAYKTGTLDQIENIATATFNDDGINQSYCTLDLPSTVINKTAVTDENGNLLTTENGETYATYTLTVTSYGGNVSGITVKDAFDNATRIKKIVVPDGGASQGTTTVNNETASLTWNVGTVAKDQSATLTYRAYLNPDAWQITQDANNPGTVALQVKNSASLYIGNDDTPTPVDTATVTDTYRKTWVKKAGELITDTKDPKYNKLKYTVKVNSDPVSDNITSIYDTLTAGGTYENGGSIELNRYTSSDKSELVDTTTIPLSEVVSADGSGYRWDIDLVSRGLNGAYYYELVYYVESSSIQVNNNAGIGFGVGPGYGVGTQVQGGGGMTYGSDYWKSASTDNKQDAYTPWTVYVQKTIQKGSVYVDWLSGEYVYKHEQFWFDDDCLNNIVIEFDGKTLTPDVDYTVEGIRDSNSYASITDPDGKRYNKFQITFNKEYQATSSNKLTIKYNTRLNTTARDQDVSYSDGCIRLYYNYCRWLLPEYGKLVPTDQSANYYKNDYEWNTPLKKGNGTYNEDDGTITWYLTVNTQTSVDGDATLEEYLPEGLSFVSAEISQRPFSNLTKDTTLGDITQEEYTNDDGKTCVKVNIPIKSLFGYVVTSSRFPTGVGPYTGWSRAGEIQIKVVTKVDNAWRLNLSDNTKLTNKAVLTDNDSLPVGGVTATGTATVPATQQIEKSMIGKENPAYVQYALNVNSNGDNLLPGDNDTLEIVDIMGEGMSLTTAHANSFKVYDVTNVSNLLDSDGDVIASQAQTGVDITDQCSIVNITGQYIDGMTDDEVGKPTYQITVPDGKHLAIIYWAAFEGAEGENVSISNRASFFYESQLQSGSGDKTSDSVVASEASSSLFVGPFFNLKKTDQWGNAVSGVTYSLYEVAVDSSGNETGRTKIMTKTTTDDETLYFGHRSSDSSSVPQLRKDKLYCLVEESAPTGYVIDSEPYYFEFKTKGNDVVAHPSDTTLHQFISGGTYSFTNMFEAASYSVPVKKTINGKTIVGDTEFSFTLKQDSNNTNAAYINDSYTEQIPTDGIKTTITGSGETLFDKLYFTKTGTYTFLMTEDDLSNEAINNGYSKDSTEYTVTIVVGKGDDNKLTVSSATFKANSSSAQAEDLTANKPTFDNELHLTGTLNLQAKKVISGNRAKPVQAGEFAFVVSVDGKVIAETDENGNDKVDANGKAVKKRFYTDGNGNINISIPIDQDDIGEHTYVISEVELDDLSIKYTDDKVKVKVKIVEAGNGKVEASQIEYPEDGAVFTNEYKATGSVKLEGTKKLINTANESVAVYQGEFNFVVMEGDTQVATGTTKSGGEIDFTKITYYASDIGVHEYTITEKDEGKMFVEYTKKTAKVKVTVSDLGDGVLGTDVEYLDVTKDDNGHMLFENGYDFVVPSGIRLEFLPCLLALTFVAGVGVLMIVRRRKRKMSR